jgi:hypothetical protein
MHIEAPRLQGGLGCGSRLNCQEAVNTRDLVSNQGSLLFVWFHLENIRQLRI